MAVLGHQEARATLHRRIGVREVRRIEDRHPEQLELGILVVDGARLLIVDDLGGADAPQRRTAAVGTARREAALLEFGDVAVAADRAARGDAGVVARGHAQRLHESFAEIVGRGQLLGANDVAVRLLELGVAFRRQRLRALVVDNAIRGQNVVVEHDLDVADRDHAVIGAVVDQLITLKVKRRRLVDLFGRRAEDLALGFLEDRLIAGGQIADRILHLDAGADRHGIARIARGTGRRGQHRGASEHEAERRDRAQHQARTQPQRLARRDPSRPRLMPRHYHLSRPPGATAPSTTRTTQQARAPRLPSPMASVRPPQLAEKPRRRGEIPTHRSHPFPP